MRTLVAAAVACSLLAGLTHAQNSEASIRKSVAIAPQNLSTALQEFAAETKLYLIYAQGDVINHRTGGASGELSRDEALQQLLQGTGLTYRLLDENTVTIVPAAIGPATNRQSRFAAENTSWRIAQADTPQNASTAERSPERVDLEEIIVTAQRNNQTQVSRSGSLGALGDQDAMSTPFALKSYNEALILNQQSTTLGEVLENDPSVRMSRGFGNAAETFVIRGFTLFGEDIAIDGLYGVTPRQLVSPELYDQVQILNGASAFLFGAAPGGSALGGTVNVRPKRAQSRPINRLTANYQSAEHFGGSFDFGRRFGSDDQSGIRINGASRQGDLSIEDEYRGSNVLGISYDWRGDRVRVSLDLAYQRVKVEHMRPNVQLDATAAAIPTVPDADQNYGQPWHHTTLRDFFGVFKLDYDLSEQFTAYAAVGARDTSERGVYQGFTVDNVATGDAFATGSYIPREDNNEAGQIGIRGRFNTGPISHQLNLGASHIRQMNRNAFRFGVFSRDASNGTNLYDPVAIAQPDFTFLTAGSIDDPRRAFGTRMTSFFASDTLGFFDDRALLTVGARRQNIDVQPYDNTTGARAAAGAYDEIATTPVVGVVIKPSESLSFYANRIEGLSQGAQAPAGTTNSGEVFPPFKTVQYELGAKVSVAGVNGSVAVFQAERPQGLIVDNTFTRDGEQRNRGLEVSVDGEPVPGLRIITGFSITDAEQLRTQDGAFDGKTAFGVPDYTANANLEWDTNFLPGFTLTGRVVQTGKQYFNQANTLQLPAWTRFDLGARYVVAVGDAPVTFRCYVDNVANRRYWASTSPAFGTYLIQGLPRTFKLSATIDF